MSPAPHLHLAKHHVMRLEVPPDAVFPLLCPVRERDWLEGWEADILYAPSGHAEPGCVFTTPGHTAEPWVWIISRHEAAAGAVQFAIHAPGSHVTLLEIQAEPEGTGSLVAWTYASTALTEQGEAFVQTYMDGFEARMERLEARLGHYLRTGSALAGA